MKNVGSLAQTVRQIAVDAGMTDQRMINAMVRIARATYQLGYKAGMEKYAYHPKQDPSLPKVVGDGGLTLKDALKLYTNEIGLNNGD